MFKSYCKYIEERSKAANYDDFVREHYTCKANKRLHAQCVKMVQAVWDINKYRTKVTSRLFDCAVLQQALIVPLLRQCKKVAFIKRRLLVDEGECDISGDHVANRVCLTLQSREYVLRSDIAKMVLYFHALSWYPMYLQSLYKTFAYINEHEEYNLLCFMHNACDVLIMSSCALH